jgi:hypothetical protein
MPDLRPDLSIFTKPNAPMSIGEMVGTVRNIQELNRQQAVTDAMGKPGVVGPGGVLDQEKFNQEYQAASKNRGGFMSPEDLSSAAHASQATRTTQQQAFDELSKSSIGFMRDPDRSAQKFMATLAVPYGQMGIPAPLINWVGGAKDRKELDTRLAIMQQRLQDMRGPPTVSMKTPEGRDVEVPPSVFPPGGGGGGPPGRGPIPGGGLGPAPPGAGAGTGPGSQQSFGPGGQGWMAGSYAKTLPTGAEAPMLAASDTATHLTKYVTGAGPEGLSAQRAMLRELDALSPKAGQGPSTEYEKKINEFAQRVGLKGITFSPTQLASTEQYDKIASQLAGQMGTSLGTGSGEWLHNAQSSNPNTIMSRMGREGIHHWLQGNLNSIEAIHGQWRQWLGQHPNMEGQFQNWINGQVPDANFNIRGFDPRVFQYEAMTGAERKAFKESLPSERERKLFVDNVRNYIKVGMVGLKEKNKEQK